LSEKKRKLFVRIVSLVLVALMVISVVYVGVASCV